MIRLFKRMAFVYSKYIFECERYYNNICIIKFKSGCICTSGIYASWTCNIYDFPKEKIIFESHMHTIYTHWNVQTFRKVLLLMPYNFHCILRMSRFNNIKDLLEKCHYHLLILSLNRNQIWRKTESILSILMSSKNWILMSVEIKNQN